MPNTHTFSVTEFIEFLNTAISTAVFPEGVVIEGEVIEYRVSQGKWIWFQLKDEDAVVSCFATVWQLKTPLEDGMQIRLFGTPKIHGKSGRFSVTVERVELVGEGALRRSFELMKKKLEKEGLFDAARKRKLLRFPKSIGIIASKESAAYGDFIRILGNRWGGLDLRLYHVQVQGKNAVDDITRAFAYFNSSEESVDALVLTRGGGSLEDLQAFNSEEVARAIFSSKIPVVIGVGHERDESLPDYVGDVRASTPSNAAEMLVPDRQEMAYALEGDVRGLMLTMDGVVSALRSNVDGLASRIERRARQMLDDFRQNISRFARHFTEFSGRVDAQRIATTTAAGRLGRVFGFHIKGLAENLRAKERIIKNMDPKQLLARGYSVVRYKGKILKGVKGVDIGSTVEVELHQGVLTTKVTSKENI